MDNDTRELLGIAKEDFWYYPVIPLLIVGCLVPLTPWGAILFGISSVLLVFYLTISTPKYFRDGSMSQAVQVLGVVGNIMAALIQVATILGRIYWVSVFSGPQ